ncbi:hypothetical protein [Roseinatronobacter alkalisoli]|uniref:Serine/threonine protein kinase n=1 Tax=Roseinatronobacter alkalisoli TaxID=3028235 RepID=A0ABT5TA16_9RHOB|nr:hypothetical protein [Roseinatronobacter sp. HJB301]MDD7971948.1 hypothetical protein [Roseinatronobacter sp. HJB301]
MSAPRNTQATAPPDTAGWTLAAGLSLSLHIGLAGLVVMGLTATPGAAPGPGTEIMLRSVPLVAGGGQEQAPRLRAATPETRLAPQEDRNPQGDAAVPEHVDALATLPALQAIGPGQPTPSAASPLPPPPAAPVARLSALTPGDPAPALPETTTPARSVRPDTLRTGTLRPETVRPEMQQAGTITAPPRVTASDAARPPVLAQDEAPRAAIPANPASGAPVRLRPDSPVPQPAPGSPLHADTPPPSSALAGDRLRMAMQPPAEDTLARALQDRPRTFLSDRSAAPRPTAAGGGLAAPAPEDSTAPDQPLYAAVLAYLRSLPDIPCFAALPALDEAGALRLEVFGPAQTGLAVFRTGLEAETGLVPGMVLRAVTQGQCETLDFIRRSRDYPAYGLYITLDARSIASGSQLEGQVHDSSARLPHLLLIDNAGRVQTLARFLRPAGDGITTDFAVPMTLQGPPVETWQLLLAISSDAPLATIETFSGPQEAAPFFARLRAEIATRGHATDLALIAFSLN